MICYKQVYGGSGRLISKKDIAKAEKSRHYKGRLTEVVKLVLGDPEQYSLTGKTKKV